MSIMYKILVNFFIVSYLLIGSSNSEIIKEIIVDGNERISKETILVLGDIDKNRDFTSNDLNNTLKKLYNTNFFRDIKISLTDGVLNLNLQENPIIEEIEITGIKKKSLVESLYEKMKLKNRMSFTEINLKKDVNLINNLLKINGYYFSKIETSLVENDDLNSIKINLNIDLGEKARIKEIIFIGDKKIKDKKLLELIASEEHKFWKFISNKVYLNKSLIDLDKRLLENYYKNNGFYDVKILNSFAELNKEGSFKLVFNINAGAKYFFNDFNLTLPEDYNKKDFEKINKIFDNLKNEKYSLNNINIILEEIENIASFKLYDFIKVDFSETIVDENKINYDFTVSDSEKFYVEKINVFGNFNTIEEVVRNNFIVDEGDPYNEILFNKSINKIKSLGIFKKVNSKVLDGSDQNSKIINISVEEKPTGEISLGAGVGTSGTVIGGGITEKNFLGKGISLNTDLEISEDGVKGSITYAKPYFNYSENTLFTTLKSTSQDNLTNFGYKVSTVGMSLGSKFEQYQNLFFSPEIDFTQEDLTTNSNASTNLKKQEGSYSDLYFNYALDFNTTNSSYSPSKGNRTYFYQELPLVSSDNEISNTLVFTQYKPLNESTDMIGKASFYFKAVNSIDGSDVRISKRGQVPYNRLRGFQKGKVGPIENDDYIGGNYVSALNLSTNLPNILTNFENLDFSYFIDVANVWGVDYDSSIDKSNKIRSSTGIALEFLSPVGPLSFSLSQPITKNSTDKTETFRFNLGTTF
jgi:outer membrane protein insertion porin family